MSKSCIFCGKKGNKSKEHLWPVWMHEFLPTVGDGNNVRELSSFKLQQQIDQKKLKRQGHLFTTKFRVVCKTCNNGWMSELEEDVKPTFLKLIKGEKSNLSEKDQEILSRWISMKVMLGEHAEKGIHVTPNKDRYLLKDKQKIPEYFAIYIGTHDSNSDASWVRISDTLAASPEGPNPKLGNLKRNTQSVTFLCGKVFIFVFASRENGIDSTEFFQLNNLQRIYPNQCSNIEWPTGKALTTSEMSQIAWALNDLHKMPNVHYGGDLP